MCTRCKKGRKRKSRVSGKPKNSIVDTLINGAMTVGGFVAVNAINNNISFVKENPLLGTAIPIAGGVLLSEMKGGECSLSSGIIAAGIVNGVKEYAPLIADTVGISGYISRSSSTPGVAGNSQQRLIID